MLVAFELSMPSKASWNGKWFGEFYHRWEDGWCAGVSLRKIDSKEATKLKKTICWIFWL